MFAKLGLQINSFRSILVLGLECSSSNCEKKIMHYYHSNIKIYSKSIRKIGLHKLLFLESDAIQSLTPLNLRYFTKSWFYKFIINYILMFLIFRSTLGKRSNHQNSDRKYLFFDRVPMKNCC